MNRTRKWVKVIVGIVVILVVIGAATAVYAVSQKPKAEAAALKHAGLSESEVGGLYSKLEMEGLSLLCDVSFWTSDAKYEYEVTAFGHEVIHFDKDNFSGSDPSSGKENSPAETENGQDSGAGGSAQDGNNRTSDGQQQTEAVSALDAKAIVVKHAGVEEDSVLLYQSEIDMDDGRKVYEIKFYSGEYEYEYKVDCTSGEILKYERDKDRP